MRGSITRSDLEVSGAAKDDVSRAAASRGEREQGDQTTAENMDTGMFRKVQIHKLRGNRHIMHMEVMFLSFLHKLVIHICLLLKICFGFFSLILQNLII